MAAAVRPPGRRGRVARGRQHHHGPWRAPPRRHHRCRRLRARAERRSMWPRQGATALVIGAGGAAAAVALALTRVPLLRLRIAARRQGAAESLAERLARLGRYRDRPLGSSRHRSRRRRTRRSWSTRPPRASTILPFDPRALPSACTVVDLRYRPRPVDVVTAALESGHRASRRARDASAAGIAELRDLDREKRARPVLSAARCSRAVET